MSQPANTRESILNMTPDEVTTAIVAAGGKAFRAKQLIDWVFNKSVTDTAKMSNVSASISDQFSYLTSLVIACAKSDDGTQKLLVEFSDGNRVETVFIPAAKRFTACVSTQAGCAMGCTFCASAMDGFQRNLTSGEILEQIIHLQQTTGERITNVVFMGMGEPLANYDATVAAVRALVDPARFGISARRVTVSTIGLPDQIRKLAAEDIPFTLAISLHAPNDELRGRIIPQARTTPIADIISAAKGFFASRSREVTLEYIMLGGVNDTQQCAEQLAGIAKNLRCNVNLIGFNPVAKLDYHRSTRRDVAAFEVTLKASGVNVNLRQPRGADIDAACGQLRKRVETDEK